MKRITLRISQTLLVCSALAVGLTACKKGDETAAEESNAAQPAAAPPAPPKPPPVTNIKLAKKWPEGKAVTFIKSVKFNRATSAGTNSQERTTTYAINFGGGAGGDPAEMADPADGGGGMDGGGGAGAGAPASLAKTLDLRIVGQKFAIGLNGKQLMSFSGQAAGGGSDGGGGDEAMADGADGADGGDPGGGGSAAPTSPIVRSVQSSLGSVVKLTYDATGNITNVSGIQGQGGIYSKVFRGVPVGQQRMVGGMFSEMVFREAPLFHTLLNGSDVKKDATWIHREKSMMLLNWQQDFTFTNTFTGMEDWNGQKVAAFAITGGISGKTQQPVKSEIGPGGSFTGKALYSADLGILVQRTIDGKFSATETGQAANYTFTQEFKVSELGGGDM